MKRKSPKNSNFRFNHCYLTPCKLYSFILHTVIRFLYYPFTFTWKTSKMWYLLHRIIKFRLTYSISTYKIRYFVDNIFILFPNIDCLLYLIIFSLVFLRSFSPFLFVFCLPYLSFVCRFTIWIWVGITFTVFTFTRFVKLIFCFYHSNLKFLGW